MKQLDLFKECTPPAVKPKKEGVSWKVFVDGASRKNPGKSGAGVYIEKNDQPIFKKGFYLGIKTNNQAEYLALLLGIHLAKKSMEPDDVLYIFSDSELMVKHMKKEYKVRNAQLKELYDLACDLLKGVRYSFCHVLRDLNKEADAMANHGIDKKGTIPHDFLQMLQQHSITV